VELRSFRSLTEKVAMLDYAIDFGAGEAVLDITLHLKASPSPPPPLSIYLSSLFLSFQLTSNDLSLWNAKSTTKFTTFFEVMNDPTRVSAVDTLLGW